MTKSRIEDGMDGAAFTDPRTTSDGAEGKDEGFAETIMRLSADAARALGLIMAELNSDRVRSEAISQAVGVGIDALAEMQSAVRAASPPTGRTLTEAEPLLRKAAAAALKHRGWKAGDQLSAHSVIGLMVQFRMKSPNRLPHVASQSETDELVEALDLASENPEDLFSLAAAALSAMRERRVMGVIPARMPTEAEMRSALADEVAKHFPHGESARHIQQGSTEIAVPTFIILDAMRRVMGDAGAGDRAIEGSPFGSSADFEQALRFFDSKQEREG